MSIYRYNITLGYNYNNTNITIDHTGILNMVIDRDYDTKNMPIIYMKTSLDKNLVDDIIKNSKTKTMTLTVSKFVKGAVIPITDTYIQDTFIYFTTTDLNNNSSLDYNTSSLSTSANLSGKPVLRQITIGLMSQTLINNNKRMINDVNINTNLIDIVAKNTNHMKMLIEPVTYLNVVRLIIPPINSISNVIKFIDSYHSLYSTAYRLFFDYDKSYLLSSSGKAIKAVGEKYTSIIISVCSLTSTDSKIQGMNIDDSSNSYGIQIASTDISTAQDKATDISYNTIVGIASDGTSKSVVLDLNNSSTTTVANERVRIERLTTGNLATVDSIKADIQNTSITISIVKTELDTSVLTMNKSYTIKNYDNIPNKEGSFILSCKKEVYSPDGSDFILTTILNLRKAIV